LIIDTGGNLLVTIESDVDYSRIEVDLLYNNNKKKRYHRTSMIISLAIKYQIRGESGTDFKAT